MILRYELFYAVMLLAGFFCWRTVGRKYGLIPFFLLVWVMGLAVYDFQNPAMVFNILDIKLRLVSCRSFALVAMLVYFVSTLENRFLPFLLTFFEAAVILNSLAFIFNGYGIFNAGSVDMAFNAMAYPLLVFRPLYAGTKTELAWRAFVYIIPIGSLFFSTPGSTVFCGLAIGIGSYLVLRLGFKNAWPLVVTTVIWMMVFGYLKESGKADGFFSDSGRIGPWKLFLSTWWNSANIITGTGTGSFQWLGPMIQVANGATREVMMWLHNEYFQILFEQGIIGLALSLALIFICLRRAYKSPHLFASCASTLFVCFFQFPLRIFLSQLFILILLRLCLDDESRKTINNP